MSKKKSVVETTPIDERMIFVPIEKKFEKVVEINTKLNWFDLILPFLTAIYGAWVYQAVKSHPLWILLGMLLGFPLAIYCFSRIISYFEDRNVFYREIDPSTIPLWRRV